MDDAPNGILAIAPGIYPRSSALVQATRDLDRGRTSAEDVVRVRADDRERLFELQREAGLDLLSDGMLDWQDHFRPFVERSEGLDARPLTRFLDTNTFFRAPIVSGPPRLRDPLAAPDLPPGRWLATAPSPYAFSVATGGEVSPVELARAVIGPQLEAWAAAGAALVVLDEPFLGGAADGSATAALAEAVAALPPACPLALRVPFTDAAPLLPGLLELPVDAVGVDFYATSLEALPRPFPKQLLAGVVDVRSSVLEDPAELAAFAKRLRSCQPAAIALCPNGDLQFVPEPIACEKVRRLGQAKATAA